jgi:hypothetical protein
VRIHEHELFPGQVVPEEADGLRLLRFVALVDVPDDHPDRFPGAVLQTDCAYLAGYELENAPPESIR